jgi:hypothetical protein
VVGLPPVNTGSALLIGSSVPGTDQGPSRHEHRFAFDDDEDVVRPGMNFDLTGASALGQNYQAMIVDD